MDLIKLKSYPGGIKIVMDKNAAFADLLLEIGQKFKSAEKFFGNAKLALMFEGQTLSGQQEDEILQVIRENSHVEIICITYEDHEAAFDRVIANAKQQEIENQAEKARFYRGNISNRKVLEVDQNIIIIGNVESGGSVVSTKNIIVLGRLSGNATAGLSGGNHFVAAVVMDPENIRIGDVKGKYKARRLFGGRRKAAGSQIAFVKEGEIQFEDIENTDELLQNLN